MDLHDSQYLNDLSYIQNAQSLDDLDSDFRQPALESKASFDEKYSQHLKETLNDFSFSSSFYSQKANPILNSKRQAPRASAFIEQDQIEDFSEKVLLELENYIQIRIRKDIEKIDDYYDKKPLLEIRKAVLRICKAISELCSIIINNSVFEVIVILVIILNTVVLALEDPLSNTQPYPYSEIELFFVIFYTLECALKISSYGFVFNKNSYLRDWWNVLDFVIVFTAWLDTLGNSGFKLSALRSIRVLRPLRSISSISGMRALFLALINSIKPLLSALVVLFFFTFVFAIGAVQLWMGLLKKRCMNINTGMYTQGDDLCGAESCTNNSYCVMSLDNPNKGVSNFDNIYMACITVFQIITMEGWTSIMLYTEQAMSSYAFLYYMPLLFIAGNLILNLTLAIITSSFKEISNSLFAKAPNDNIEVDEELFERIYNNTRKETPTFNSSQDKNSKKLQNIETEIPIHAKNLRFDTNIMNNARTSRRHSEEFEQEEVSLNFWEKAKIMQKSPFTNENDLENDIKSPHLSESLIEISPKLPITKSHTNEDRLKKLTVTPISYRRRSVFVNKKATMNFLDEEEHKAKQRTSLFRLKKAITIKKNTLKMLKMDPDSIKKSRLELLESYKITSESFNEIIPIAEKQAQSNPYKNDYVFRYKQKKHSQVYEGKMQELIEKYPDYETNFHIFRLFAVKKNLNTAFFDMNIEVRKFVADVSLNANRVKAEWSGYDVGSFRKADNKELISRLSYMKYHIWSNGHLGSWERFKYPLKFLISHQYANSFIMLSVIINTSILAYDHYGISSTSSKNLQMINTFFTYFFASELILKLLALGPRSYLRDFMNYFDIIVVTLSLVEIFLISEGTSAISAFRAIRIFRIFRVLKVIRLFRYLKSLENLLKLIGNSIASFSYLFLLLLLFQLIFTLLGMQIYGGTFNFPEGLPRGNFDTFHWAFITTFQVLSTENWNDVLTSTLRSTLGVGSSLFLICWIIFGNFILLNLFLAILLDSVGNVGENENLGQGQTIRRMNTNFQMRLESIEMYRDSFGESEENSLENLEPEDLFKGVGCERSYYIFSKENALRKACMRLCRKSILDNFILMAIILNSLKLAWDTYTIDQLVSSPQIQASEILDNIFTSIFILEFLIKSISFGFINERMCYIRDNWNKLDFLIVILSLIDLSVSTINLPIIKLFRLLRTLRPLRLINHNVSMKIAVSALVESLIAICNVLIVIFIIWLVFAILGVSLLSGKMYYCTNSSISEMTKCLDSGYSWVNTNANFDNIFEALVTLFIVMSQESWPNRMYEGVDAQGVGLAPQTNYNPSLAYFYVVYLVIGNFFLVNLFTVIVFSKFDEAKRNETSLAAMFLTKKQMLWNEIQELVVNVKPESAVHQLPQSRFRVLMHKISKSRVFEVMIMAVIILNMLIMALPYEGASDNYMQTIEYLNMICTYIFILEAGVKILGLGHFYFRSAWNCFDFFIVSSSIVDLSIVFSGSSSNPLLRQGPQLVRVVRVLRISRLLRLVKSLESLQKLITIITYALPAILNVLSLLILVFFIYAILGSFLFHDIKTGNAINQYFNFYNFHQAMRMLWRISTGEDYPTIMFDCVTQLDSKVYIIYFLSFVIVIDFVVLDLFVSIILQNYEEFSHNPENSLSIFTKDLKIFKKYWMEHTNPNDYHRIHKNSLIAFIKEITSEYKLLNDFLVENIVQFIGSMNLVMDSEGYAYFHDILYGIMKKRYSTSRKKNCSKHMLNIVRKEEHKIKCKLKKIREKYLKNKQVLEKDKDIFVNSMFLKNILKKWKGYCDRKKGMFLSITSRFSDLDYPGENSLDDN